MVKIAGITKESFVDGAGIRYTIFVQGCGHNCPGCHNPETHKFSGGKELDIEKVILDIEENPMLDGITLSGGDPMYQAKECCELIKKLKNKLSINYWCYTGFTFEECLVDEDKLALLSQLDVLVDGPFVQDKKCLASRFKGSTNQRVIDVQSSLKTGNVIILEDYNK